MRLRPALASGTHSVSPRSFRMLFDWVFGEAFGLEWVLDPLCSNSSSASCEPKAGCSTPLPDHRRGLIPGNVKLAMPYGHRRT